VSSTRASDSVFVTGRTQRAFVLVSWLLTSALILTNESRTGDLSRWYTDHLHHNYATWVFFHRGLDIYRLPFGEAWKGVDYPQASALWEQNPMVYPPGVFVVFLPTTLLGRYLPMDASTFGRINVLYMLALAHVALWWLLRALGEQQTGARGVVLLVSWMYLARLGLQGFYDCAWIAAGGWMLWAASRQQHGAALRAFALAAMLHYRAVVLAPLALAILLDACRGRVWRQWPWKDIVLSGLSVVVCLGTFALMYPVTERFRGTVLPLYKSLDPRFWAVIGATVIASAVVLRMTDAVTAGTTLLAGILGTLHVNYWWHGSVVLFAPLAVDVFRRAANPSAARAVLLSWLFFVQPVAWHDHPGQVFTEIVEHFRWRWR
jgi:hypothetical protein